MGDGYGANNHYAATLTENSFDKAHGKTESDCKVRVFFAKNNGNADIFPDIMKRLTASFGSVSKSANNRFAHLP